MNEEKPSPYAWIYEFIRPLKPIFREVLAMSFFINIIALAVPIFVMQVYDRVVFHAGISTLQGLVIGMIFVLVFDFVLKQARSRVMQTVALRADVLIGKRLFNKMMGLPMQTLESQPTPHWQSLYRDVDTVRNTVSGSFAVLLVDIPFAVLFLGLILIIASPLTIVIFPILAAFLFVAWRSGNVMAAANQMERRTSQNRDGLVGEMLQGRTTIKALALDGAMRPLWEKAHADNIEQSIQRGSKTDLYSNIGASLTMATSILMTTVGAIAIVNQEMTMGSLIAANMLSGRLLGPLNQLVGQWRTWTAFKQSVERLGNLFLTGGEREESDVKLEKPKGEMSVENVCFAYVEGQHNIVNNIQLDIPAGGIHALVGRNGSGKTTLLKILQGLYKPSTGRVVLDGADIAQFTRAELAHWMGYVPQECVLFAGTVRDNITHRVPGATDEMIIAAAKAAGVHEFIIDMPDGYATEIGEAGSRLSGGQRQRIAIARALVGDPPVVMLDEPSSSLDRQAEIELRKTLVELGKKHTVIIVTHSPILLAACDHLVALERGRIALAGPSKEILPRLFGQQPNKGTADKPAPAAPSGQPPIPQPTATDAAAPSPSPLGNAPKAPPPPLPGGGNRPADVARSIAQAGGVFKGPTGGTARLPISNELSADDDDLPPPTKGSDQENKPDEKVKV